MNTMSFEDDYLDVLQNIEFAIASTYRENTALLDYDVRKALNALWAEYRAERAGKSPSPTPMNEGAQLVYDRIRVMCEWRLGRTDMSGANGKTGPRPAPITLDEITACLKRILKSVDLWNKNGGRQGYLSFIVQHIQ